MNRDIERQLEEIANRDFQPGTSFSAHVMEEISKPKRYNVTSLVPLAISVVLITVMFTYDRTPLASEVVSNYVIDNATFVGTVDTSSGDQATARLTAMLFSSFAAAITIVVATLASLLIVIKKSKAALFVFSTCTGILLVIQTIIAVLGI